MITRKTLKSGLYFYGIDPARNPGGYFQLRRSGGLGPHIKFGGKIWGKVWPSSQNKRKNLGSSVTKRRKSWEKVPILGLCLKFRGQNLGYLSFIFLEAKFGAKPPRPSNMELPSGARNGTCLTIMEVFLSTRFSSRLCN